MTLYRIFQVVSAFLSVLRIGILIYWFLMLFRLRNGLTQWLETFLEPFLSPFRSMSMWLMRRTNLPLDFSYFFALIGLSIVNRLWWMLYSLLRGVLR